MLFFAIRYIVLKLLKCELDSNSLIKDVFFNFYILSYFSFDKISSQNTPMLISPSDPSINYYQAVKSDLEFDYLYLIF